VVEEGVWVKGGQPLARLDDTLLRSQVEQQAALASQLQVQAERAEAEAARVKDLDNASVFAQEQIEARRFTAKPRVRRPTRRPHRPATCARARRK
jgi:HlyD family secretion protein